MVLTLRVSVATGRRLATLARRRCRTRSEIARELIETGLTGAVHADRRAEARRQSMLASRLDAESDALRFVVESADLKGWK